MSEITQETLKSLLNYNQESGVFTWKTRSVCELTPKKVGANIFNSMYAGKRAGNVNRTIRSKTCYIHIKLPGGRSYKAHRLAFLYMDGVMPEEVDHIDHNGLNNKWSNLRASNRKDNSKNLPIQKSNKTGVVGVNWHKAANKWQARAVDHNGKRIDLGRYESFNDAVKARREHEIKFGYYENRDISCQ